MLRRTLNKASWRGGSSHHLLLIIHLLILFGYLIHSSDSFCVSQGGGGFRLACGFRQSGLFRIRSLGGLKGWAGAGFTVGDEDGFKDSLSNNKDGNGNAAGAPGQSYLQGASSNIVQRLALKPPSTLTNNNNAIE